MKPNKPTGVFVFLALLCLGSDSQPTVQWVGNLSFTYRLTDYERLQDADRYARESRDSYAVTVDGKPFVYTPPKWDMRFSEDIEVGLRSDGTMVWRRVKNP